ncbi:MAG: HAMP domain-containing histidine kinase [Gammaproteobacteria bacterium]|nr:HAMP domain-containing histidine kinase [Gammaproteobacteria bacterium]
MADNKSSVSLKSSITIALVVVSMISLVFSVFSTTYYTEKKNDEEAVRFIKSISEVIAFNSEIPLAFDQQAGIDEFLFTLQNIKSISNIHIYRKNDLTDKVEFFTSYNQKSFPLVAPQIDRIEALSLPTFTDNYLEFTQKIKDSISNENIGYVYVRMYKKSFEENIKELLQYNVLMALIIGLVAYSISQYIRSRVLTPINRFVHEIQELTFNKHFNSKVTSPGLSELQPLSDSVNAMLLKITKQIKQFEDAESEIKELNSNLEGKVVSRTQALRDSNQELLDALEQVHQYQSQVIQSEKMASLGQMVAGVAHEVNTPIGLGVTASTMLSDKIDEIQDALDNQSLSAKKLKSFLVDGKENTQIIFRNLNRAADLISSFKQVAVDQSADSERSVQLKSFVDEVLLSLMPTIKKSHHTINVHCDAELEIKTKPGPINQVIINMIMNSYIHAFDGIEAGIIDIEISFRNGLCHMCFQDNGKGIEEKIKQKIFDPFVTTRRGEGGSGLGLHLVYNLVTQALGGSISVESELGKGARFNLSFPATYVKGGRDD